MTWTRASNGERAMRERFGRFWSAGVWQRIAVIIGALLLCGFCWLVVGSGVLAGIGLRLPDARAPGSGSVIHATKAGHIPELGDPFTDFNAAYGLAVKNGAGAPFTFWVDQAHTARIAVTFINGHATHIMLSAPTDWNKTQTFDFCSMFLPPDASVYNVAGQYTDYHSSLGNLVLANYGNGACEVFIAGESMRGAPYDTSPYSSSTGFIA
jgi:hypothetical protein